MRQYCLRDTQRPEDVSVHLMEDLLFAVEKQSIDE